MVSDIYKNYEPFYNMVLSTTIMSNAQTDEYKADSQKIIQFIGKAYKLSDAFISECCRIILEQLICLSLTTDKQATYSTRKYGAAFSDEAVLFDIKCDVLTKLQGLSEISGADMNPGWFDYSHFMTYKSPLCYSKLLYTGATGNIIATRQVGILLALGIGCQQNLHEAKRRFLQCAFWGDIPSMYYLAYTFTLANDPDNADLFFELADLSQKYLLAGYTVLPDETSRKYSEDARAYYTYISTIKQDIINAYDRVNIDFSFLEAIMSDTLDYYDKLFYINNYDKKEWKNLTNSSDKPVTRRLGFK